MPARAKLSFQIAALLFTAFLVPCLPATAQDAPAEWKAVYEAGAAPFVSSGRINVTIADGNLVLAAKKRQPFSVPAHGITAVTSNLTAEHTLARNQVAVWSGLAQFSPYTLLFLPAGLPVLAATYPVKSKYAYISILWTEAGTDEEIHLRLDRKDYQPFLAALQQVTGKEWKNLETEWQRVQHALASNETPKTRLRLDRAVRVGTVDLKAGLYQLVLLQTARDRGEAYFFPNNQLNIEHLAATTLVEILPAPAETQIAALSYKENAQGLSSIAEIGLAQQLLRFP